MCFQSIFMPNSSTCLTIEELELVGKYMGYEVINYKGNKTFDINIHAKNIGQNILLWQGANPKFTGRRLKNFDLPIDTDWRYIMPILKQIQKL